MLDGFCRLLGASKNLCFVNVSDKMIDFISKNSNRENEQTVKIDRWMDIWIEGWIDEQMLV